MSIVKVQRTLTVMKVDMAGIINWRLQKTCCQFRNGCLLIMFFNIIIKTKTHTREPQNAVLATYFQTVSIPSSIPPVRNPLLPFPPPIKGLGLTSIPSPLP